MNKVKILDKEREYYDNLADLYSIFIQTEHLERAYIRSVIKPEEYTTCCLVLLSRYKTLLSLKIDVQVFIKQYQINCPLAIKRLVEVGI